MKRGALTFVAVTMLIALTGCGPQPAGESGTEIISAEEALEIVASNDSAVLVDTRPFFDYGETHVEGAVNVTRENIVVSEPFPNLVGPPEQIEEVMGERGIGNETLVVAYDDNNNMDAARLWWTLKSSAAV